MSMNEVVSASAAPFAEYKLLKPLGMGEFATVYCALHMPSSQRVAIKLVLILPFPLSYDAASSPRGALPFSFPLSTPFTRLLPVCVLSADQAPRAAEPTR